MSNPYKIIFKDIKTNLIKHGKTSPIKVIKQSVKKLIIIIPDIPYTIFTTVRFRFANTAKIIYSKLIISMKKVNFAFANGVYTVQSKIKSILMIKPVFNIISQCKANALVKIKLIVRNAKMKMLNNSVIKQGFAVITFVVAPNIKFLSYFKPFIKKESSFVVRYLSLGYWYGVSGGYTLGELDPKPLLLLDNLTLGEMGGVPSRTLGDMYNLPLSSLYMEKIS